MKRKNNKTRYQSVIPAKLLLEILIDKDLRRLMVQASPNQ